MASSSQLQSSGMLSREQLLQLFDRFSSITSGRDTKKRIAEAFKDNQEAVAVTTAIQEEIFLEMGVDPGFGLSCLGKVNSAYENDRDLMVRFYKFVANEEMVCEEAELGPEGFMEKMDVQQQLQQQKLEMLNQMRKFHLDDQSAILEKINDLPDDIVMGVKLHQQMENANFEGEVSALSPEQIQEIVQRRVSPLFKPR